MKSKTIIVLLIVIGALYLGGRYVYYGPLMRNCIYTENRLPVPEQLTKGEILVAKDAYLAIGIDKEYACLKNFGSIDREIVGADSINNLTIGRHYFTDRGLTVESLKKGASFRVVDVVAVTKHGLSTIDSGPGPIYYLILKDQNNISYQIATVSLGLNKDDLFLSFVDSLSPNNTSSVNLLSPDSFDETADYEGGNSLKYTGKLTELTDTYLKSTEPQWKKLSDRLEHCIYTENRLPVPEQLTKGEILVAKDAYLAIGIDKEYACLKNFGSIDREIVGADSINNLTIGRHYFTDRGLTVESLKKGASFRVVDVVAVTKHGLSTIDSGPGPIYYLILKDQNNISYQIATVSLGLNKDDLFLSFVDSLSPNNTSSVNLLSPDSFDETADYEGGNSLKYTGRLTELTDTYLKSTEPQWKKLSDRLERGEKFDIMVVVDLRDDNFMEIKLSDNQVERSRQVAQIQDEFLKKIPSNLVLKGVEKDKAWPYVSMEANLDLLTYLVDEQVTLKIKSISELTRLP